MTVNMFEMLDDVTFLVRENRPDEAYARIKHAIQEDEHGFALIFISEWMKHLSSEGIEAQEQFSPIIFFLKEEFPELLPAAMTVGDVAEVTQLTVVDEPAPVKEPESEEEEVLTEEDVVDDESSDEDEKEEEEEEVPSPVADDTELVEQLTLTFYEWQKDAIAKAAHKQNMDEQALVTSMLETGNPEPLAWSRYHAGKTSPTQRIVVHVPHHTKESLEAAKDSEGIKTTTRYVRKLLFGNRSEKA